MIRASIVTYHTPLDELSRCLDSLGACPAVTAIDIIDNGSEPRIAAITPSTSPSPP